jgi:poly(A) polymerase
MGDVVLPDAAWRKKPGLAALIRVLGGQDGDTRYVGGAVRDTLAGQAVKDVDLATKLSPEDVLARLAHARIKAVPTGLAHGTVTAVIGDSSVEVTTLRRDVSTDGRRATVAFTDDWKADAARRDFTINALYADPESGALFDYFGGLDDLAAGRVRFIGEPLQRIAEDHLRILRFFRFHARFGQAAPDAAALAACAARANDLMTLSRERIADELLKLLALSSPVAAIRLMRASGIFAAALPELATDDARVLDRLIRREAAEGDPLRRMAALLPPDPVIADTVAARLKLSKAARKRLACAAGRQPEDCAAPRALAYRFGLEGARDRLLLSDAPDDSVDAARALFANWTLPRFPLTGGDLIKRGLPAGPKVAAMLRAVEDQWVAEGFPDARRAHRIADAHIARSAA